MDLEAIIEFSAVGGALASSAYFLNNLIAPIFFTIEDLQRTLDKPKKTFRELRNPEIDDVNTIQILEDSPENALKYLKLANEIALGSFNRQSPVPPNKCEITSRTTYGNFVYLVEEQGLPFLKRYVRLSRGTVKNSRLKTTRGPHTWLEIKLNSKWVPYETTSNKLKESNGAGDNGNYDYWRVYSVQETGDRIKINIHLQNVIRGWHSGVIQMSYSDYKNR